MLGALIVPWEVLVSAMVVSAATEVLAGAEAVAEADALADAEGLEVDPPAERALVSFLEELPPQAARPKVAARLRDRTTIDFFTVFSFLHAPLCDGAVHGVVDLYSSVPEVHLHAITAT